MRNVCSTIRCEPYFVGFLTNAKGIRDDVCTTVSTVRQCGQAKQHILTNDLAKKQELRAEKLTIAHPRNQK